MPPELPEIEAVRSVHLVAVAGSGMGTLACMLADRGFEVTGSDLDAYPPMSEQLQGAGIAVEKGFAAERVERARPDLVVIGNAVRRDNPEARAAIESRIPYLSFADAVHHFFIRGKHSVVVVGTHGKTTSTAMLGWILTRAGCDPSLLLGGVANNFGAGFRLGEGPHFVIEGDEYDTAFFDKTPKFLHYGARTLLFTSCEFDHADIYADLVEIKSAFRKLVGTLPEDGRIIAANDGAPVREVLETASVPVEGYGFADGALWKVSDVAFDASATRFNVWRGEERLGAVQLPLHGRHNVENALGALALAYALGVEVEAAAESLAEFTGVRRRQELRGEAGGMLVMEDFAHHPTAVRETIAAMRARFPEHRIHAVFEPRTHTSRRRVFEEAYVGALAAADSVILAGVYRPEQIPEEERMRPERVAQALAARGVPASFEPKVDDIIECLVRRAGGRDLALVMSNGEFGAIWERLLRRLEQVESG